MATALEEFVRERLRLDIWLGIDDAMGEEWYLTEADFDCMDLRGLDRRHMQREIDELDNNYVASSEDSSGGEYYEDLADLDSSS